MNIRRVSLAALFALAVPLSAFAQSRGASRATGTGLGAGVLIGMESGDGDTGLALRGDAVLDSKWIAPNVLLSGVLSLGFTRFSNGWSDPNYKFDVSDNIFKVIPAVRFTFDIAPQFGLYADAGIGFYFASIESKLTDRYWGTYVSTSDSAFGVMMRFAGGAFVKVSDGFRLGAEMGFNPYFGDFHDTTFSLMGLAQFRL